VPPFLSCPRCLQEEEIARRSLPYLRARPHKFAVNREPETSPSLPSSPP
jgi:hypothetical protein